MFDARFIEIALAGLLALVLITLWVFAAVWLVGGC